MRYCGLLVLSACGFSGSEPDVLTTDDPPGPSTITGVISSPTAGGSQLAVLLPAGAPVTSLQPCLGDDQELDMVQPASGAFLFADVEPGTYLVAVSRFELVNFMLVATEVAVREVTVRGGAMDLGTIELPPRLEVAVAGRTASWSVPSSYSTAAYKVRFSGCERGTPLTVAGSTSYSVSSDREQVKVVMEQPQGNRFALRVVNPR